MNVSQSGHSPTLTLRDFTKKQHMCAEKTFYRPLALLTYESDSIPEAPYRLKPCPHCRRKWDCRRKVRLSPKTARQRRNSATVATVSLLCDSLTFLRQIVALFCDSVDRLLQSRKWQLFRKLITRITTWSDNTGLANYCDGTSAQWLTTHLSAFVKQITNTRGLLSSDVDSYSVIQRQLVTRVFKN